VRNTQVEIYALHRVGAHVAKSSAVISKAAKPKLNSRAKKAKGSATKKAKSSAEEQKIEFFEEFAEIIPGDIW